MPPAVDSWLRPPPWIKERSRDRTVAAEQIHCSRRRRVGVLSSYCVGYTLSRLSLLSVAPRLSSEALGAQSQDLELHVNFDEIDRAISSYMRRWGTQALRISLGVIFIWFGILKPLGL